ncbi:glycerol-3-phosphate dehydrogenase/oxidase [Corynebacterium canis]|uniref:Glycerol-3-phosphate dehydrogenase n=1 Tax=Corynebacterium canis TaxID=679663 RepID=A0A5C5UBI0_9CORY|nr:glycerol-3-phosphate dehydrogenase/oxidase [Corynebacterium canis]TWT22840.1 glycerol-3-phosphate dehydrogenase/oxidase [Corynebacterium canis]WJY76249.1 Aerobic glycerol-3-phosphate dehydrogenase [Corynebacterium canis]
MASSALHADQRAADLQAVREGAEIDLLVVGGGITGAGIALDAATRGLRTVLVERHDLAFGTSRFSSKLIHGGLRYLAKFELSVARNSAVERGRLMELIAPHLVRPLAQVSALGPDTNLLQKAAMRAGYLAGDVLRMAAGTSTSVLPRSRYVTPAETRRLCPAVNTKALRGAWVNYDGAMIDDARLVTAVARTAAREGARVITRCAATDLTGTSATLTDTLTGESFPVSATAVVNATGVWAGTVDPEISIRPSRGTHLVFRSETFGNPTGALTFPLPGSLSRFLFILPEQLGRCYLGLTDEDTPGDIPDVPSTPEEDIEFLLTGTSRVLGVPLRRADVVGAFTGLRPLIDAAGATSDLSRRHAIITAPNGLISVVGGKFTEYRLMAEETVDAVVRSHEFAGIGGCATRTFPLVGAPTHMDSLEVAATELEDLPDSLVARFGFEAPQVVASATVSDPLGSIAGMDITRAEIEYAITHEGALNVDDILDRRTRIGLVPADRDRALPEVEAIFHELRGSDALP